MMAPSLIITALLTAVRSVNLQDTIVWAMAWAKGGITGSAGRALALAGAALAVVLAATLFGMHLQGRLDVAASARRDHRVAAVNGAESEQVAANAARRAGQVERIVEYVEREKVVPGPERIVEKAVPGPERIVEKVVPGRVRIVRVPASCTWQDVIGLASTPKDLNAQLNAINVRK